MKKVFALCLLLTCLLSLVSCAAPQVVTVASCTVEADGHLWIIYSN